MESGDNHVDRFRRKRGRGQGVRGAWCVRGVYRGFSRASYAQSKREPAFIESWLQAGKFVPVWRISV